MSPSQHHVNRERLALRQQGRRRVAVATRSMTMAGTALAAVFGVLLAQHSPVAATQPPSAAPTATTRTTVPAPVDSTAPPAGNPAPVPAAPTSTTPPAPVTVNQAPQLQPPVTPPAPVIGPGSNGSSGGS